MNLQQLSAHFQAKFGYAPTFIARAPGRVNLIGEHTDYNDGFVLPMAIDRAVMIVGAARTDRRVRVDAVNLDQVDEFSLDQIAPSQAHTWSNYVRGVAVAMQKDGQTLVGFDGVLWGDVPISSGLSSSAATEMATTRAFAAAANQQVDGVRAAQLGQRAEIDFVGVNCGIMDQFISSLGKAGYALFIDCRSLDYDLVALPQGVTVLVVDTKAPRTLAGSAYNERVRECAEGAAALGVKSLRDVSVADFEHNKSKLTALIARRCAHIVNENQRVLDAVQAARAGDAARLGQLMNESHDSLRDLYSVSSKELDTVVEIARAHPGVYGARMTGAGFGGCAIALVQNDQAAALQAVMAKEYPARTGRTPSIYACVPSDGAGWKSLRS